MRRALLGDAARALRGVSSTPLLDAQVLLAHALGVPRSRLFLHEQAIGEDEAAAFLRMVARRADDRVPVAHLTERRAFWTLDLVVTQDTLIPRPETELLVGSVLDLYRRDDPIAILDVGTGSGCVLLALLSELPNAVGVGIDVCVRALGVARRNGEAAGLENRIAWKQLDVRQLSEAAGAAAMRAALNSLPSRPLAVDLVVSNPPYIRREEASLVAEEVARHEPSLALWGWGAHGVGAYRALGSIRPDLLTPRAALGVEIGAGAEARVRCAVQGAGSAWRWAATHADLRGTPRCVHFARDADHRPCS